MMAVGARGTIRGELRYDEPMSAHTSWRVGGPADMFYIPADLEDLRLFLQELPKDVPVFWFGLGSNLLLSPPPAFSARLNVLPATACEPVPAFPALNSLASAYGGISDPRSFSRAFRAASAEPWR